MASAAGGATCEAGSHSDSDHTCLKALLDDGGHWQTDGEGHGTWIKVSFPRANIGRLGLKSVCNDSARIKRMSVDIGSTGEIDFEVSFTYLFLCKSILLVIKYYD